MKRLVLTIGLLGLSVAVLTGQITQSTSGVEFAAGDLLHLKVYSTHQINAIFTTVSGKPLIRDIISGPGELKIGMTIATGGPIPAATTITQVSAASDQVHFLKNGLTMTTGSAGSATLTIAGPQAPIVCPYLVPYMEISTCPSLAAGQGCDADGTRDIGIPANTYILTGCTGAGPYTLTMSANCAGGECTETDTGPAFTPIALTNNNATSSVTNHSAVINGGTVTVSVAGDVLTLGAVTPTAITPFGLTAPNVLTTGAKSEVDSASLGAAPGKVRSLVVTTTATEGPLPNSTWAEVSLKRGSTIQAVLQSGPITQPEPLIWPGPPSKPLRDTCRVRYIARAAPTIGDDYVVSIPSGLSWGWLTGGVLYSTNAVGGDRSIVWQLRDRTGMTVFNGLLRPTMQQGFESALLNPSPAPLFGGDFGTGLQLFGGYTLNIPRVLGGAKAAFLLVQTATTVVDQFTSLQLYVDECIVGEAAPS